MTSESITFLWAEVENFRGFRDRQRIELDASVVILYGPNGTGKTSLFDALQWLLLGKLERLEPWRVRRNVEHITNAWRPGEPAVVRAGVDIGGHEVELRRQGRHDAGLLEWSELNGVWRGDDAERRLLSVFAPAGSEKLELRRLLMTSALLQQDVVREVLEDKPAERYRHLAALLGLDSTAAFEAAARRRADNLADIAKQARADLGVAEAELTRIHQQSQSLSDRLVSAPDTARVRANLVARLQPHAEIVRLTSPLPEGLPELALLQAISGEVATELERISSARDALRDDEGRAEHVEPDAAISAQRDVEAAAQALSDVRAALEAAESEFRQKAAESDALQTLAAQALPLLGDRCPVCGQAIDENDVRTHLNELLQRGGAELPLLEQRVRAAREIVQNAELARSQAQARFQAVEAKRLQAEDFARRSEQLNAATQRALARARNEGLELVLAERIAEGDSVAAASSSDGLRAIAVAVGEFLAVLRAAPLAEDLASTDAEVRRLEAAVEVSRERAAGASMRAEEAKTLQRSATRAAAAVTETRFQSLAPVVKDIFSRLDPHPVFKTLDFSLGVFREQGIASPVVRDDAEGIEANPLLVFSSSQVNVAALSYFLAVGWAAGAEAMPFVLLDDPLQSLDDVNSLGFADLCRHIRATRQLVVSTHDARLASLERKLAPRVIGETTRFIEFRSWTRRGPDLEQRIVDPQLAEGQERVVVTTDAA